MPDYNILNLKLGDIEFIRQKVLDGDWITVTGDINAVNDNITYTPASGKTFFFYDAKITITGHPDPAEGIGLGGHIVAKNAIQAELRIDTVTKDTANVGALTSAEVNSSRWAYGNGYNLISQSFNVIGLFMDGNASKVVEIRNILDDGSAIATFSGWIEDT